MAPPEAGLLYSNLSGESSQAQTRQVLEQAGIAEDALDKFFAWVDDFNQAMKDCSAFALQDEFALIGGPTVDYGDYAPASALWYKTNGRPYSDILCRIAAFHLMEQFLTIDANVPRDQWQIGEDQWLCSDYDAISNFPIVDFSEREIQNYFTLYNPIPADRETDEAGMAQLIKQTWQERKIAFSQAPVSLLTVWLRSGSQIAAGHAALLVEARDAFWVVEKTNPQSPYQAAVFSSRERAAGYLYEASIRMI